MEYLFSAMSQNLYIKASLHLKELFCGFSEMLSNDLSRLITVHIRWGDKRKDMDVLPISDFIVGIQSMLTQHPKNRFVGNPL
jgi:hypothetical protein